MQRLADTHLTALRTASRWQAQRVAAGMQGLWQKQRQQDERKHPPEQMHQRDHRVTSTAWAARVAFARAASTDSSRAKATPMRRWPATSGLPNRRSAVSGSARAAARLPKAVSREWPS